MCHLLREALFCECLRVGLEHEGDPCCCDKGGHLLEFESVSQILGDEDTLGLNSTGKKNCQKLHALECDTGCTYWTCNNWTTGL